MIAYLVILVSGIAIGWTFGFCHGTDVERRWWVRR
jgi:hypothetical protein